MNILLICEGLNSLTAVAQPWRHVIEISKRMKNQGNNVKILTDHREETNKEDEIDCVPIRRIRKRGFLFDIEELKESINEEDFDIVNWHGSDTWSSFHLWRLRKRIRTNIIWTLHSGPVSMGDFRNIDSREVIRLYKRWNTLLNATLPAYVIRKWVDIPQLKQIIVPSKRLSNRLETIGIAREKIDVIPSGVDTRLFKPSEDRQVEQLKQSLGFDRSDALIFYFGPLSTFRGIDTLIAAMPIIQNELPNARLVVLGRSQEISNKLRSRHSTRSRVTFVMGVLKQESVIQYLSLADVVVLPFKFWPQVECPLTVLESMAMEKPLITTEIGAIPEIICDGKSGILVSPKDPKEIADKVILLLQNESLGKAIGKEARRRVERFFDWKTVVQRTLTIFRQVADND